MPMLNADDAVWNKALMPVTDATFHREISPWKAVAPANTEFMFVTLAVFQPPMFWLKILAELNICQPTKKTTV